MMLAVLMAVSALQAHAWKSYSDAGSLLVDRSRDRCLKETPQGFSCISKETRYVRTDTGSMPVRLWSISQLAIAGFLS